ncbi:MULTISPECIES: NAD-dependent epimerase/dehydratase family protein [Calothrix]|uniref:GDP-mannose 4,6-dehydratase n=2 Tax=Calothrix TaxID=1186 RepID=A0ABR8AGG4_9CYAN|nr:MULTISPECIES: NAD-dependent epimerase/dehydratase family protein [Calothrix]MBD2199021.1 GDP-mannose 4,6-dehydratase [Calothrix parietina FACHB-288]MBD2227726.1 GDP-mannose 4,6-dehydratase [Calothrix anomala FACHB-343]
MIKILVTGASGFTGRHLVKHLNKNTEIQVYCNYRNSSESHPNYFNCDLTDEESVYKLIETIKPAQIYHLAGSFSNDYNTDYLNNVISTRNILEAILKAKICCRVLLIGSSAEYGLIKEEDNPVNENQCLNPISIYGLTKVYQNHLMLFYFHVHKLDIVMARTFNLMGKGISEKLFIGRIYKQIEDYQKGLIDKIVLGDLRSYRDYISIQQAVKYYESITNYGISGEVYNVGSGLSLRLDIILEKILQENGLNMDVIEIQNISNKNKLNINNIYADISKFQSLIAINHTSNF